jgi:hypothetical protein
MSRSSRFHLFIAALGAVLPGSSATVVRAADIQPE